MGQFEESEVWVDEWCVQYRQHTAYSLTKPLHTKSSMQGYGSSLSLSLSLSLFYFYIFVRNGCGLQGIDMNGFRSTIMRRKLVVVKPLYRNILYICIIAKTNTLVSILNHKVSFNKNWLIKLGGVLYQVQGSSN